jgi:hypothetical protein
MNIIDNSPRVFSAVAFSSIDQKFRQWLQQRGFWSENAERLFLCLLYDQQVHIPFTGQQKQMLRQAIEDASEGINITERYPALFRDLLCNARLRQEFVNLTRQIDQPISA